MTLTNTVGHFIGEGEHVVDSGRTFTVVNPATGEPIAVVEDGGDAAVERAVAAATTAYDDGTWRTLHPAQRAKRLRALAALVESEADEIAALECRNNGKPLWAARADLSGTVSLLEYCATLPEGVRGAVYPQAPGYFAYSKREPYGVVGAISAWNFPFMLAAWKTVPALAVGNSVVLKPAEQTPLTSMIFGRLCVEAGIPPGVLSVVNGEGPTTGAALVRHPHVSKLTFTGSTAVGREILRTAADRVKSCHLELGGKGPNIVLADADLEQAAAGSVFTGFYNTGQVCTSGTRLLVAREIADEFVERLTEAGRSIRVGDPTAPDTQLGPLISEEQRTRVERYIESGLREGGQVLVGGGRPDLGAPLDGGYFVAPTLFAGLDLDSPVVTDEIFGPVVAVHQFDDVDEAIRLANASDYGLAATVWTNGLRNAMELGDRLESGIIWTNCPHHLDWHVPYEGAKQSGLGEDLGSEVVQTFTRLKVHYLGYGGERLTW